MSSNTMSSKLPNYKKIDYRGFAFVVHKDHGMILLHCTRKPKKGPHYQLPGGHIDDYEFEYSAEKCGSNASTNDVLLEAAKSGTARELFEETGIDIRGELNRLDPVALSTGDAQLGCILENKCYFSLHVSDDDFPTEGPGLVHPKDTNGSNLSLTISHEHSGFIFENDPNESIKKIEKHSGGTGSRVLLMLMNKGGRGRESSNTNQNHEAQGELPKDISTTYSSESYEKGSIDLLPPSTRRGIKDLFSCFSSCCR